MSPRSEAVPAQRPVIGLSTYRERAQFGRLAHDGGRAPRPVRRRGPRRRWRPGAAARRPPAPPRSAHEVVARLDGLVVTGGADVDPDRYGQEPAPQTLCWREDRDAWETGSAAGRRGDRAADARRLPWDAADGGGRRRRAAPAHARAGRARGAQPGRPTRSAHTRVTHGRGVDGARGCSASRSASAATTTSPSTSHPGFTATAWADDGSLEAMELPGDRFCLAVQWHPEVGDDATPLRGAGRRRARRSPQCRPGLIPLGRDRGGAGDDDRPGHRPADAGAWRRRRSWCSPPSRSTSSSTRPSSATSARVPWERSPSARR